MSTGDELRLGKFGNNGQINTDSLKGGVKKEAAEKAGFGNIFNAFDDGNGVLTDNEINTLKQGISEAAKHGKDSIFSQNEAEEYIKTFNQNAQNSQKTLSGVTSEKLFDFLKFVEKQAKSVISSTVDDKGNIITKYRNEQGQEVTESIDKNTGITEQVVNANGKEIKTYLKGDKKTKTVETDSNGTVTTTEYADDGETITSKKAEEKSGKTTTAEYEKGTVVKETISDKDSEEVKTLVNGELKTTSKIENKNDVTKRKEIVNIKYTPNGRIETIKDTSGEYTVEYNGNEVITKRNGKTTKTTTIETGKTEVITNDKDKDSVTTLYNKEDKKLKQTKVVKGKEYSVEYDGNGNTTGIVVQYGENAEKIAKKFGVSKEALLKANGKQDGEDFKAGDTIVIPKEIEADDQYLKNRKSSDDAIKDQQKADERARQREIARQKAKALDKQYRAAGLKNYEHKGETFKYENETYTVIGTMNNRARLMVKDSKGNITIASWDKKILKDSYVQLTTAYDKAEKVTLKNGKKVAIMTDRNDGHGRKYALDEHGRQVIVSGGKSNADFSDRVVLDNSFVDSCDQKDFVMSQIKTAKDDKEKEAIIEQNKSYSSKTVLRFKSKTDGKVWYFDAQTGKPVNFAKIEADAIIKELDDSASGWFFGLGTDTEQMAEANNAIIDPAVLDEINKHYSAQGYNDNKYKSAFEAFLSTEISDSEIYELNADLVNNGAIINQSRRDEILLSNMTTYGTKSANRNKALKAISNRTDYNNLQANLAKYNKAQGYNSHFKGQDALQTTLYNQTNGNVVEIDSANRALIDSNETFLSHDEIIRINAEVGAMYAEKGDKTNAFRSHDKEIYDAIGNLERADGSKIDVAKTANKLDLMIAEYGDFTVDEYADLIVTYLETAYRDFNASQEIVATGEGLEFATQQSKTSSYNTGKECAVKALQLLKSYEILQAVKDKMGAERYSTIISSINSHTSGLTLSEALKGEQAANIDSIDFSSMKFVTSKPSNLSDEEIENNMAKVQQIKNIVYELEKGHLDEVDGEGWKQDFIDNLRQISSGLGTRASVREQYNIIQSRIQRLELAANGQLVDANGKAISFEDAAEEILGINIDKLQKVNQQYTEQQMYGEMGLDIAVGVVTMPLGGSLLSAGKIVSVGSKVFKVLEVVDKTSKTYKLAELATTAASVGMTTKAAFEAMDQSNLASSTSGYTIERRGAASNKADEMALNAMAGTSIGGVTGAISSKMTSTIGRAATNVTGYAADLSSASLITQAYHGGEFWDNIKMVDENGNINTAAVMNNVMTSMGYLGGLKAVKGNHVETPNIKPTDLTVDEKALFERLSKQNTSRSVGKLNDDNFNTLKSGFEKKLKAAQSESDIKELYSFAERLENREQRRLLQNLTKNAEIDFKLRHPATPEAPKPTPEPKPEPTPEPKPEPAPEPKPIDDPNVNNITKNKNIFNSLPDGLKKAWSNIEEAISSMKTFADFQALKTKINNYFSGKTDAFNSLMTKLNERAKQLKLDITERISAKQTTEEIRTSVHNKLAKGHSYEIDQNIKLKVGDEIIGFNDLSDDFKRAINNLEEGYFIKVGRDDINPLNDTISREHFIIRKENGKLYIEDISRNGTMILDDTNAAAYKSIQKMKKSNPAMRTKEYSANESKFLETVGNDYDLLNKLLTSEYIDINSHSFKNIMNSTNINNKAILETFLNNSNSIQTGNRFSSTTINNEELSLLMLFNRNNKNAAELVASPSKVKEFLNNTNKQIDNLRKVYANDYVTGNLSNSEIADAILYGKTRMSDGNIVEVTPNVNILDDIENLVHGKDYIQHFSDGENLTTVYSKTQTGDVASINGKMYVNDGNNMIPLALSESSFRELFPPIQRFSMHQGAIGTCYLDTSINILANSNKGRAKLYQMIGEDFINGERKIYTTTANGNGQRTYFERFTRSGKNLRDRNGLAIIEQGYCMNSKRHALDKKNVTRIMMANEGGTGIEALSGLTGDVAICVHDPATIREKIKSLAGRDDVFIYSGSKRIDNRGHDIVLDPLHDVHQQHAYTIRGYDSATDMVTIANPWHSGVEVQISMDEYLRSFSNIQIAQIM